MQTLPDCVRGDTYGPVKVQVSLTAGSLANCPEITFTVRAEASKSSPILAQVKKSTGRVSVVGADEIQFDLTADETAPLPTSGTVCDVECVLPDATVRTVKNLSRFFRVLPDVT